MKSSYLFKRQQSDKVSQMWFETTYAASFDFPVDECASKASTEWTFSTHLFTHTKTQTRSPLPWRGYQADRSRLRGSRMTWQPSACV